ncbi:MAG: sulfurtransferase [Candidatus Hydrogenedens sp.]|nr:sulfurtransferase [Candidatus Hydrogenedens sp.]
MNITVEDLKAKMDAGEEFLLLDVRTEYEREIVKLDGGMHMDVHDFDPDRPDLAAWKDRQIVCMCHHGGRSAHAQHALLQHGYSNVLNLDGGIHAWALRIDPSLPTYD